MSDPVDPPAPKRRRRRIGLVTRLAWGALSSLAILSFVLLAGLALSERRIGLPEEAIRRIEARVNASAEGFDISVAEILVGLDRDLIPRVWAEGVEVLDTRGQPLLALSEVGVAFDPAAALRGRIAPSVLRVTAPTVTLRRDAMGAFEFSLGGGGQRIEGGIAGVLSAIQTALAAPPLDRVAEVAFADGTIIVEDARSARVWQLAGANVAMTKDAGGLSMDLGAEIFDGTDRTGRIRASATAPATGGASASVDLRDVAARDIALQSPALSFLSILDAPLSGALRASVDDAGALASLAGTLGIGPGTIEARAGATLPFDAARAYFSYDPADARLEFSEISARGAMGQGRVSGHVDLAERNDAGFPNALIGQFTLERVALDAPGFFDDPVTVDAGQADLRVRLRPFAVEIGQLSLPGLGGAPGRDIHLGGRVSAEKDGWHVAVDGETEALGIDALLRLWPLPVASNARRWLEDNIRQATARDAHAALRYKPGDPKPRINTTFDFDGARVRVFPDIPDVTDGAGIGSIVDDRLVISVEAGDVRVPDRGTLSLAGSTFVIPDGRIKPSPAVIDIRAQGAAPALLSILDSPRLKLLQKAGRNADLATGDVRGQARIDLVLQKGNTPDDIGLQASAVVSDLRSTAIVPGRTITSPRLAIEVDKQSIRADGPARFDGIPFRGGWRQALSGEDAGQGRVQGEVDLSPDALAALGVKLPEGLVSGSGTGTIDLAIRPGRAPTLALNSDLRGVGLSIEAVNWFKPRAASGDLSLAVTLDRTPRIDALSLEAPGLAARGRVALAPGPRFEALELDRVRLGGWLDGAVTITARGAGKPPAIAVRGGEIDIRRARLGGSGGGGGGGGAARGPVSLRLDSLRVTDTLALRSFSVDLAAGRALSGQFTGRVNGGTEVVGLVGETAAGPSVRVQSRDAGAVLRDTGLFSDVRGGALDLVLQPTGEDGTFDGQIRVTNTALRDAPAMAELLSAVSVVGLLEQLGGQGIPFDEVSADFRISPSRITLYRSSATGNSLGLSMDGVFDPRTKVMDLQGVVSPIYLLNRVGSIFTRRGEGLFGVNFTLRGTVSDPRVGVNPLSLLTPGGFREIFRRDPPQR